jgi:hypothetical protein
MTATLRPKILDHTLNSFCEKMFKERDRYRLIINIDPIGDNVLPKEVLKVARKYFDNILYNYADSPGFTKAVIWCWSQVKTNHSFNLEDDWELLIPIDIDSMITILDNHPDMAGLRLNKENTKKSKCSTRHGYAPHLKLSLNPTLFKGSFIKGVVPRMSVDRNPEKQLRPSKSLLGEYMRKWSHGIYTKESRRIIVKDIGRLWMDSVPFKKRTGFLQWERK